MDRILSTVERITFNVILLAAALFMLNLVVSLAPDTWGRTLVSGISIFLVIGALVLIIWVFSNAISASRRK